MSTNASDRFFDKKIQRQLAAADLQLNPFEQAARPYLQGRVLDYGCGLGNLALAAAQRGCSVVALDASPAAIEHLRQAARAAAWSPAAGDPVRPAPRRRRQATGLAVARDRGDLTHVGERQE